MIGNIAKHFLLLIFIFAISLVNITSTFALGKIELSDKNPIPKGKVNTEVCKRNATKTGIAQYSETCKTQCTSTEEKFAQFKKDNKEACDFLAAAGGSNLGGTGTPPTPPVPTPPTPPTPPGAVPGAPILGAVPGGVVDGAVAKEKAPTSKKEEQAKQAPVENIIPTGQVGGGGTNAAGAQAGAAGGSNLGGTGTPIVGAVAGGAVDGAVAGGAVDGAVAGGAVDGAVAGGAVDGVDGSKEEKTTNKEETDKNIVENPNTAGAEIPSLTEDEINDANLSTAEAFDKIKKVFNIAVERIPTADLGFRDNNDLFESIANTGLVPVRVTITPKTPDATKQALLEKLQEVFIERIASLAENGPTNLGATLHTRPTPNTLYEWIYNQATAGLTLSRIQHVNTGGLEVKIKDSGVNDIVNAKIIAVRKGVATDVNILLQLDGASDYISGFEKLSGASVKHAHIVNARENADNFFSAANFKDGLVDGTTATTGCPPNVKAIDILAANAACRNLLKIQVHSGTTQDFGIEDASTDSINIILKILEHTKKFSNYFDPDLGNENFYTSEAIRNQLRDSKNVEGFTGLNVNTNFLTISEAYKNFKAHPLNVGFNNSIVSLLRAAGADEKRIVYITKRLEGINVLSIFVNAYSDTNRLATDVEDNFNYSNEHFQKFDYHTEAKRKIYDELHILEEKILKGGRAYYNFKLLTPDSILTELESNIIDYNRLAIELFWKAINTYPLVVRAKAIGDSIKNIDISSVPSSEEAAIERRRLIINENINNISNNFLDIRYYAFKSIEDLSNFACKVAWAAEKAAKKVVARAADREASGAADQDDKDIYISAIKIAYTVASKVSAVAGNAENALGTLSDKFKLGSNYHRKAWDNLYNCTCDAKENIWKLLKAADDRAAVSSPNCNRHPDVPTAP